MTPLPLPKKYKFLIKDLLTKTNGDLHPLLDTHNIAVEFVTAWWYYHDNPNVVKLYVSQAYWGTLAILRSGTFVRWVLTSKHGPRYFGNYVNKKELQDELTTIVNNYIIRGIK